jgi:hypothetical protein
MHKGFEAYPTSQDAFFVPSYCAVQYDNCASQYKPQLSEEHQIMSTPNSDLDYEPIDYDEVMRMAHEGRRLQSIALRDMIVRGFKGLMHVLHIDNALSAKASR